MEKQGSEGEGALYRGDRTFPPKLGPLSPPIGPQLRPTPSSNEPMCEWKMRGKGGDRWSGDGRGRKRGGGNGISNLEGSGWRENRNSKSKSPPEEQHRVYVCLILPVGHSNTLLEIVVSKDGGGE